MLASLHQIILEGESGHNKKQGSSMDQVTINIKNLDTVSQYKGKEKRPFLASERATTTILISGLTWRHERLVCASLRSIGYKAERIGTPAINAYHIGKEFGNNGQCNPTYFTVGNLVEHLQSLEESGLSKQEICDNYVFLTAGACGPCRFGMYEAEYNLALENSGFGDFRVITFQQKKGLQHDDPNAGINKNLAFHIAILAALTLGDIISELRYKLKPYEVNTGSTDTFIEQSITTLENAFIASGRQLQNCDSVLKIWNGYIFNQAFKDAFKAINKACYALEMDYMQVKPKVKITGEFWAQITEGDGNFNMFEFLEEHNAEIMIEPIGNWIMYMLHQVKKANYDNRGLVTDDIDATPSLWRKLKSYVGCGANHVRLSLAEKLYASYWEKARNMIAPGLISPLTNQKKLSSLAHEHLNTGVLGGEGHLEVAKNIYTTINKHAHMVLSLKPFGCMPSTQSDGVQSKLPNLYPDMIFLPLATGCEGKVNAQSRVMMALDEARKKALEEFNAVAPSHSATSAAPTSPATFSLFPDKTTGTAARYAQYVNTIGVQNA